jgi:hypothetical protein
MFPRHRKFLRAGYLRIRKSPAHSRNASPVSWSAVASHARPTGGESPLPVPPGGYVASVARGSNTVADTPACALIPTFEIHRSPIMRRWVTSAPR